MTARRVVNTDSPVIFTAEAALLLRMHKTTAVQWLHAQGVRCLPDAGRYQRWSRAAVLAAIERASVAP